MGNNNAVQIKLLGISNPYIIKKHLYATVSHRQG